MTLSSPHRPLPTITVELPRVSQCNCPESTYCDRRLPFLLYQIYLISKLPHFYTNLNGPTPTSLLVSVWNFWHIIKLFLAIWISILYHLSSWLLMSQLFHLLSKNLKLLEDLVDLLVKNWSQHCLAIKFQHIEAL